MTAQDRQILDECRRLAIVHKCLIDVAVDYLYDCDSEQITYSAYAVDKRFGDNCIAVIQDGLDYPSPMITLKALDNLIQKIDKEK